MKTLSNVNAIITGATSGLGFASAKKLLEAGARVGLLARDEEPGKQIARQLGDRAFFVKTDVCSEQSVDQAIVHAQQQMGSINFALNCAGVAPSARVLARDGLMPTSAFSKTITVNLIGTFCVSRAAANCMQHNLPDRDGQRGLIINTASIAAYDGQIGQVAYAASKAGVVGMTLPLAREFGRCGIRVMCIAPGLFETPMLAALQQKAVDALAASIPFPKRLGASEEYAQLVMHIILNPMLNGSTIRLDGGLRM